ncbi:hypothetical protein Tco_0694481 [Tanacetum coccineum]
MGDENPIRTLGDYSKPSHEGYRNTIELLIRNNVIPFRSDTIRLVQNGCSFHGLRGKLRHRNAKESWALLEDLALYDNESWNNPRDFAKPVKAIALPQDVSSTSDRRLIELENQVQRLMEAHFSLTQPTQVNKITTSCEICSVSHNTQYCMEDPEQAYVEPLRMTKVIKREFEKPEDLNDEDVLLTCGTSLEVFNNEFNRMSGMDDDLFSYEVEVANIPCDSNKDDDSEKKALWIYWIRGDDEVELTDKEFSDNEDEVAEVFRIDTNIFNFETPMCKTFKEFNYLLQIDPDLLTKDIEGFKTYEEYKDDWIYEWNKDIPWVDEKPWTNVGVWTEATPVCNMRRFEMIKYSFGQDEEYVAVKEDEYDDLARTSDDACRAYQEIFRMMDEGWMDLNERKEIDKLVEVFTSLKVLES